MSPQFQDVTIGPTTMANDDIVILEAPPDEAGIIEVTNVPAPAPATDPIYYRDGDNNSYVVFADRGCLYFNKGTHKFILAASAYIYQEELNGRPALAIMMGNTPVFFADKEAMDIFIQLQEHVSFHVAAGKHLVFLTSPHNANRDPSPLFDNVVVVFLRNDVLYTSTYNSFGSFIKLRLRGHVCDGMDKIFKDISRLTNESLKDVRAKLRNASTSLSLAKQEAAEEMYLYMQDVPVLPGREAEYERLRSMLENRYTENSQIMVDLIIKVNDYENAIAKARSQLPSGRRGTPIKQAYLKSVALNDMLDNLEVTRAGKRMAFMFCFRQALTLEGIHYGRPIITVNMTSHAHEGRDGTFIRSVYAASADKVAFMHPHIDNSNRWCLGTYITPLNNALMGGNLPLAASLLWQYISRYNHESPLINLDTCRTQMAAAHDRAIIIRRK